MPNLKTLLSRSAFLRGLCILQAALLVCGLAATARPVYHRLKRGWALHQATARWQARDRTSQPELCSGRPIAWLTCRAIALDTPVLFGATGENLLALPCLSERGALPGADGTILVQAHRDAQFRDLGRLAPGDVVQLQDFAGRIHVYRAVETEIIAREALEQRFSGHFDGLVLITCYPFDFLGPAPDRYLVWLRKDPPG